MIFQRWGRVALRPVSTLSPGMHVLTANSDLSKLAKAAATAEPAFQSDILPEALVYSPPWDVSELSNGLQVVTEPSSVPLAYCTVTVEAGSRHAGQKTAGLSYVLSKLKLVSAGVALSRLEDLGARVSVDPQREVTQFHLHVDPSRLDAAFPLFASIIAPSKLSQSSLDAVRSAVTDEVSRSAQADDVILDATHTSAFRNHSLGAPLKGTRKSLQSLYLQDVLKFQETYYLGSRMSLAATGSVSHPQVLALATKHLGKLRQFGPDTAISDPPPLTGSQVVIKNSDMDRVCAGVFFKAPSRTHEDYYAFMLLKHVLSGFRGERDFVPGLPGVQSSNIQKWLGDIEDVVSHRTVWMPYRDTGLFGHITACWDLGIHLAPIAAIKSCVQAGGQISEIEFSRAKNQLYREILTQSTADCCAEIGLEALYLHRRVPRSEIAHRVEMMDTSAVAKIAKKWFWNSELVVVFYGPGGPEREYAVYRSLTTSRR